MTSDLARFADSLAAIADAEYPLQIVELMADEWVATAQDVAPVDTGFMRANTAVSSVEGTPTRGSAEVVSRADYAGFVNGGTRNMGPRPFFEAGMVAAEQLAERSVGVKLAASMEAALDGGVPNPLR